MFKDSGPSCGVEMSKGSSKVVLDVAVINLEQLICVARGQRFKVGNELDELYIIEKGALGVSGDRISYVGRSEDLLEKCGVTEATQVLDGSGKIALPGFVDPHTHLVFSGTREHELALKLRGKSYLEILKRGGGILHTVKRTRAASTEQLVDEAEARSDRMLLYGTTTAEAKSGYGLDGDNEIKSLEAIAELNSRHPVDLVPTFLGAHAVPPEFEGDPGGYVEHLVSSVLPAVKERGLAEYCDVFLEKGVFGVDDSRKLLTRAKELGFGLKLHIDEIENLGGAALACELDARSVEHLVKTSDAEIRKLAEKGIVCIFLPGTPFSLMEGEYPRAKQFIQSGCVVSLATDLNPNCMCESMQNSIALACYNMGMTPAQVISASTINAAYGINRENEVGSLEVGKKADVTILDIDDLRKLPYHFGVNHVVHVIKNGNIEVLGGALLRKRRAVFVYAFKDDKLMMVRNIKRGGWEIPGGGVRAGETLEAAARREFLEETGQNLMIVSRQEVDNGTVFFGRVGERVGEFDNKEISEIKLTKGLLAPLNYSRTEYRVYLKKAPGEIRPSWV